VVGVYVFVPENAEKVATCIVLLNTNTVPADSVVIVIGLPVTVLAETIGAFGAIDVNETGLGSVCFSFNQDERAAINAEPLKPKVIKNRFRLIESCVNISIQVYLFC